MLRRVGALAIVLLVFCAADDSRLLAGQASPQDRDAAASSAPPSCDRLRQRGAAFTPLAKACDFAIALPHTLPDLVCTENVKRFLSPKQKKPDIITAELTIERMRSRYSAVTVNGKPAYNQVQYGKSEDDLFADQAGSTGEFASLFNVFDSLSQTEFAPPVDAVLDHRHAKRYDFRVKRENNVRWAWYFVGATLNPGYHGAIFVDAATGDVRRLVLQVDASEVDPHTPVSDATTTIDYDDVVITGVGTQHVPVRGENVSCLRGLAGCMRVSLLFSNFHKFGVATRILP